MADLNTLRRRRRTWDHLILGVFVLAWFGGSVQPCLMAMELAPNMAVAMESGHSVPATHHEDTVSPAGSDADCEHCPPTVCELAESCDVGMSFECQPDVQCSLDTRRAKQVLKDAQCDSLVSIAPTVADSAFADHKSMPPGIGFVSRVPGYQTSLILLNCIFLI